MSVIKSHGIRTAKILEAALANSMTYTEEDFDKMPLDIERLDVNNEIYAPSSSNFEIGNQSIVPDVTVITNVPSTSKKNLEFASTQVDLIEHLNSNSDFLSSSTNIKIKLVDYNNSSSDEHENCITINKNVAKPSKKRILFGERFDSNRSFFSIEDNIEDSDFEFSYEENEGIEFVGNGGKRKKKRPNRKSIKKAETNLGKERNIHAIPCKSKCQNQCAKQFTETERQDIHEFYWGLGNYERQRNWLLTCVETVPIRRRIPSASVSRRQNTFKYCINWNERRIEVCQQFLLATLDVSQMTLRYAVSNAVQKVAKPDQRGKHVPHNKTADEIKQEVHNFIKKLPAVPSHYCRNKSDRKYLSNDLRNVSFLYRIFLKNQEAEKLVSRPSLKVFRDIFLKDFNLGFHQPKKDKCRICECRKDNAFNETEESKEMFAKHLQMKEQSKELFLTDQMKHLTDDSYLCASFDLQKVLNTPYGDNLLLYYSRKYAFYNETVYESGSRNGICFIWGESDGNRGCNEICTIMFKYLEEVDGKGTIKHVILYCDSCAGQNRNRAMLIMLQTFVQKFAKHVESVRIVFLVPGHTYMPVDSVHATIDRFVKKRVIWAPSEWDTILTNARVNPRPLSVVRMQHSDFRNWKKVGDEQLPASAKLSDGKVFKISLVKQAIFQKGKSNFEVNFTYDAASLGIDVLIAKPKGRRIQFDVMSAVLYAEKLEISTLKKKDLDNLCNQNVIPTKYHQEFFNLRSKSSLRDTLPETDAEDADDDDYENN